MSTSGDRIRRQHVPFTQMPDGLFPCSSGVSVGALALWARLQWYTFRGQGCCMPSRAMLAADLTPAGRDEKVSRSSVDRWTDELIEKGWLRKQARYRGGNQSRVTNLYTVMLDPKAPTPTDDEEVVTTQTTQAEVVPTQTRVVRTETTGGPCSGQQVLEEVDLRKRSRGGEDLEGKSSTVIHSPVENSPPQSPPEDPEPAQGGLVHRPHPPGNPQDVDCRACGTLRKRGEPAERETQVPHRRDEACRLHPAYPAWNCGGCRSDRMAVDEPPTSQGQERASGREGPTGGSSVLPVRSRSGFVDVGLPPAGLSVQERAKWLTAAGSMAAKGTKAAKAELAAAERAQREAARDAVVAERQAREADEDANRRERRAVQRAEADAGAVAVVAVPPGVSR